MALRSATVAEQRDVRAERERGSILVEFGFIALLMYLLLAVTVDFGRLFYSKQAVQDVARATARELSVIPLPPDMTFDQAMATPEVRARVFKPEHLVIDLDNIPGGVSLQQFVDSLPVLNRMLRPLMIYDVKGGRRLLRYPGALLLDATTPSGFTVGIPLVEGRDAQGVETIRWVPVIEEIKNPNFPAESPYSMTTPAAMPERGLVAIRINYPYQASMMSAYLASGLPAGTPRPPNLSNRIQAIDGSVAESNTAPGTLLPDSGEAGPYAGPYGLGRLYVAGDTVRPFRRLLTEQMIFRREVFQD